MLFLGITLVESGKSFASNLMRVSYANTFNVGAYIFVLVVLYAQSLPESSRGFSYSFYADSYDAAFLVSNVITACAQLFATLLIVYKAW